MTYRIEADTCRAGPSERILPVRVTRIDMPTYNPSQGRYRWARYLFTDLRKRLSPEGLHLARKAYLDALAGVLS